MKRRLNVFMHFCIIGVTFQMEMKMNLRVGTLATYAHTKSADCQIADTCTCSIMQPESSNKSKVSRSALQQVFNDNLIILWVIN